MASKPYDIVLIPEESIAEKASSLSKKLERHGTFFTLDNETFFPHISLYMLQLDDAQASRAFELLEHITTEAVFVVRVGRAYHYENDYFDITYEKQDALVQLQHSVIEALNPLRDGLREKDKERILKAEGATLENLRAYGYRSVGSLFDPHMTFTRFTSNQEKSLLDLPPVETFNGNFSYLGIYEMGENGTCLRLVKKWELKNLPAL